MPSLRVGVIVRWPQVEKVVVAMLVSMGHRAVQPLAADTPLPDLVVRDASCEPPAGWGDQPGIVLCSRAVGVQVESTRRVRLGKPFSVSDLQMAIGLAIEAEE